MRLPTGTNTYDLFTGDELKIAELIQQRRYQVLSHSCIYYYFDNNILSDKEYDTLARELEALQLKYLEISKKVILYEYFKDFKAGTGFDLPIRLPWVQELATRVMKSNGYVSKKKDVQKTSVKTVKKDVSKKRRLF